ncbi:MAG: TIGR03943 family protein [Cryobacterium sp.]|nr:TIGR03943 family protein [Cryobacterium sp.]
MSVVGIVATLWLAVTGQLGLYIHPRYFAFTTIMAGIAVVFVVLAFLLVPVGGEDAEHDAHDHGHDHGADRGPVARAWWFGLSVVLVAATAGALLVLPPATLTTATVDQRVINSSVAGQSLDDTIELAGGDEASFTVKDWAGLLRQGADERTLTGKSPTLVGFVTPDTDDPENVFYVARFVVTCCAVDAQPVGVPVYLPGWRDRFAVDEWVSVTGTFSSNPSIASMQATVLTPREITSTEQPADPYVY